MQPKQKTRKRGHHFNRFILRRARERVTENRDSSNGPFQGLRSAKRRVKEITSRRRCDLKTGHSQPEDGRRRKPITVRTGSMLPKFVRTWARLPTLFVYVTHRVYAGQMCVEFLTPFAYLVQCLKRVDFFFIIIYLFWHILPLSTYKRCR